MKQNIHRKHEKGSNSKEYDLLYEHLFRFINSNFYFLWQKYCTFINILSGNQKDKNKIPLVFLRRRHEYGEMLNAYKRLSKAKAYRLWKSLQNTKQTSIGFSKKAIKLFPPELRLNLKRAFFLIRDNFSNPLDQIILKDLQSWSRKRNAASMDIFLFGVTSFLYRFQRPQHFAVQLASHGHRVFYIENEFILNIGFGNNPLTAPVKIKRHQEGVYGVSLWSSHNYFIYNEIANKRDVEKMFLSLKRLIYDGKIVNGVCIVDHPFWTTLAQRLSLPIFYNCMDNHSGFMETGEEIEQLEKKLVRISETTIVTSEALKQKMVNLRSKKIVMIPNACDFKHFNQAKNKIFPALSVMNQPIIGYFGAIADWFDVKLIEKVALKYRDCTIMLIGSVQNEQVERLAKRVKNIMLLGEQPYEKLPRYLSYMSVCLIPFVVNDLIKATNPVKVYEYFAAGKPVVTTALPEVKKYKKELFFSKNHQEFIENVGRALNEKNAFIAMQRTSIGQENTWKQRGDDLDSLLSDNLFPKVSIVVLSHNNIKMTEACIQSIWKRSNYPNLELIVVDNASDKATVNRLKELAELGKFILIPNKINYSFSKANNIGLKRAKGEYFIVLNNDTLITPGWISRMVFHIRKKGVGLVGPVTNNIGNEAKIMIQYNPDIPEEIEHESRKYTASHWGETLNIERIAAFCWMMSKNTFKKIGGFDEQFVPYMFEDDDYCIRVRNARLKIFCAEDVFIHHYLSASIKANPKMYKKYFEENKYRLEKKWGIGWQSHTYRPGVT